MTTQIFPLFRGKRYDGKWIEGDLLHGEEDCGSIGFQPVPIGHDFSSVHNEVWDKGEILGPACDYKGEK